jgi:hypothetical protein
MRISGNMPLVCFSLLFATDTFIAILMCWILHKNRTEYAEWVADVPHPNNNNNRH